MGSGVEGWGVVALPLQGVHLVLQQDKLHSDKNKPSPRNPTFDSWGQAT